MKKDYLLSDCKYEVVNIETNKRKHIPEQALVVHTPDDMVLVVYVITGTVFESYTPKYLRVWKTKQKYAMYPHVAEFTMDIDDRCRINNAFDCAVFTLVAFTKFILKHGTPIRVI